MAVGSAPPPRPLFRDAFETPELVRRDWLAIVPEVRDARTSIEDGGARLVLPAAGEIAMRRFVDVAAVRGKRVRISARVRVDPGDAAARVVLAFGGSAPSYRNRVEAGGISSNEWGVIDAVTDIDEDSRQAEISLVLNGPGSAWFDDVEIVVVGPTPLASRVELSQQQLESVEALARAVAVIRYRHPSDQVASLDWNAFLTVAMERVLRVRDRGALIAELTRLFEAIAPTVEFSGQARYARGEPAHGGDAHLVRWQRAGVGAQGRYPSWREGRDVDRASVRVEAPVSLPALSQCRTAQLKATASRVEGDGEVLVYAEVGMAGEASKRFDRKLSAGDSSISLDIDMPADAFNVRLGVRVAGRSAVRLEGLAFECRGGPSAHVDIEHGAWTRRGFSSLYASSPEPCGARRCMTIARKPLDTSFVQARDVVDVELAAGLWAHVPVAIWSDGARSVADGGTWKAAAGYAASDLPVRLAIFTSAWATLSAFYPYFGDLRIDWRGQLRGAITEAAAARSTADVYEGLSRLLAKLHDNHARVIHPAFPIDGVLPVALRRFGDKLVVVGGLDSYVKQVPIGTEVIAIDGAPALKRYAEMTERVSSATPAWSSYVIPLWLTLGPLGTFSTLRVRAGDSGSNEVVLPHMSRTLYDSVVREPRPAFGAVLAPDVYYVDLETLEAARWKALLPTLGRARAIVLDMRGYPSNAVFEMLGHFIDKEVSSPEWQIPILGASDYQSSNWTIRPTQPRIAAKVIVLLDGRSGSAAETFLQIVQDNQLARLVGEPSAGTNGNMTIVALPGGFSLRFTGVRVPRRDGTALHGRGITPDVVVHPTLDGVRAGRDEILEAAVSRAQAM